MKLPWWLNPWREAARQRDVKCEQLRLNASLHRQADDHLVLIGTLQGQAQELRGKLAEAERQLRNLAGPTPEGQLASSGQPDFVLIGIPRPGMGVRLVAARNMAGAKFGMTDAQDPPPRWIFAATLAEPLFIDRPTYDEAIARLGEIWANWLRERPELQAGDGRYRGSPQRPAGHIAPARPMLGRGGDDNGQRTTGRA